MQSTLIIQACSVVWYSGDRFMAGDEPSCVRKSPCTFMYTFTHKAPTTNRAIYSDWMLAINQVFTSRYCPTRSLQRAWLCEWTVKKINSTSGAVPLCVQFHARSLHNFSRCAQLVDAENESRAQSGSPSTQVHTKCTVWRSSSGHPSIT
jgi:hypothetical protein